MAERPVMLRPLQFGSWLSVVGEAALVRLLGALLDGLDEEERERVLDMARSREEGDVVDDVFNTNSFGVPVAGVEHSALFPDVGLINHACRPK